MTTYFTSDLHLGHADVLAFAQRPWATIGEHDAALIDNINAAVGAGDELYILGDFTLRLDDDGIRPWLDSIKCENRWLVLGNHDRAAILKAPSSFRRAADYMEVTVGERLCCLSHYPMLDWNRMAGRHGIPQDATSIMLHGHVHSQGRGYNGDNARGGVWRYDVGVDANGYRPVSLGEIEAFMRARDPYYKQR